MSKSYIFKESCKRGNDKPKVRQKEAGEGRREIDIAPNTSSSSDCFGLELGAPETTPG